MNEFVLEIDDSSNVHYLINKGCYLKLFNEIEVYYYGNILNRNDVEEVLLNNLNNNESVSKGLMGNFTIIVKNEGKIIIEQDYFGGESFVYYTQIDKKKYIFSSLEVFKSLGFSFQFNYQVADEFIYNGVIKSRDTLVKGIYKLLPQQRLVFGDNKIFLEKIHNDCIYIDEYDIGIEELYELEKEIISDYLSCAFNTGGCLNMTLSSGYDSNLILNVAKELGYTVNTYSCGGKRGVNETKVAEKISGLYDGVSIEIKLIGGELRSSISDIVQRLDGALYERGIFLQYALAQMLRKNKVNRIVLGECADQIFNQNFYEAQSDDFLMDYIHNPYELGSLLVLKKSTMMLSSFGIVGLYPFVDPRMIRIGYNIRLKNGIEKRFQKKMCDSIFPEEIKSLICKQGGSTSLCALFKSDAEEEDFIRSVEEDNEFFRKDFRINCKYDLRESKLDYYVCLEYLRAFKKIFCEN